MTNITGLVAAVAVGVYFGVNMLQVPDVDGVAQLCISRGITRMRIHEVTETLLKTLQGKRIRCTVDITNRLLKNMKVNSTIDEWYYKFVAPFSDPVTIEYIAVGEDGHSKILPTLKRLRDLIHFTSNTAKLTTVINYDACLISKDLPSSGHFHPNKRDNMKLILNFLAEERPILIDTSVLMVNLYPYKKYVHYDKAIISLEYATFEGTASVQDGKYTYHNLFDEMVDTVYVAIDNLDKGLKNIKVWIGETGWPTNGRGALTNVTLARKYNQNFIEHIRCRKGTPRRPNIVVPGYIRSLFNENASPKGEAQYYGIFNNDFTPVYSLNF